VVFLEFFFPLRPDPESPNNAVPPPEARSSPGGGAFGSPEAAPLRKSDSFSFSFLDAAGLRAFALASPPPTLMGTPRIRLARLNDELPSSIEL
jgi:hypothetical protein